MMMVVVCLTMLVHKEDGWACGRGWIYPSMHGVLGAWLARAQEDFLRFMRMARFFTAYACLLQVRALAWPGLACDLTELHGPPAPQHHQQRCMHSPYADMPRCGLICPD